MTVSDELARNLVQRVNVGDLLTRSAARRPRRLAVVDGQRRLTYAEFNDLVNQTAHGLLDLGYRRGDAFAVASANSVEFLAVYLACAKTGMVCVPINLGWRDKEIGYVLEHSNARGILAQSGLLAQLGPAIEHSAAVADVIVAPLSEEQWDAAPSDRRWRSFADLVAGRPTGEPQCYVEDRDPLCYLYTSGTTASPKGVVTRHTAIYLESLSMALESRLAEDDRIAAILPMFHTGQLNASCTPAIAVGAAMFIERGFDPGRVLDLIEREGITQLFALPLMYRAMAEHPAAESGDLSSLRQACYAMAPMPDTLLRRCMQVFGCDFYNVFGQTEMSPVATLMRPEYQLSHAGAVGTAVANVQVAIMDAGGNLLEPGHEGEIVYRGPHALSEYLKDPEATRTAFGHGWFHSGDAGRVDGDGVLWFTDRYKDVIKTGGENVASIEVEKAVYEADRGIAEAVVVGLPHDYWGEAITAVVVPAPGASVDPSAVIESVKHAIDGYKVPKAVIVAAELPKTSTGKVKKNLVRQQYADHYSNNPTEGD